jgi:tyrosyl-tRNA synthetase
VTYDFKTLKEAILFNTAEVLPTDEKQLDQEIQTLVDEANKSGQPIRHYIGFEISGKIHIAYVFLMGRIKLLQDAGVECTLFLADYHTWLNEKLDGKIETARKVAKEYFGPCLLKCAEVAGCDSSKINLIIGNELYSKSNDIENNYWTLEQKISQNFTLSRVQKSITITGKKEGDNVKYALLRYPVMQVTDAFYLQAHLVHAGMDQRKCHVLMREVAPKLGYDFALKIGSKQISPIAIHEGLMLSMGISAKDVENKMTNELSEELKMSKSKPDSAIWVHDSNEEIMRKLKKAYCPMPQDGQSMEQIQAEQIYNPLLDWSKKMIYPAGKTIAVERPEKFGGNKTYKSYKELEQDYFEGNLHPLDFKNGLAAILANWFEPIKKWIEQNPQSLELLEKVKKV